MNKPDRLNEAPFSPDTTAVNSAAYSKTVFNTLAQAYRPFWRQTWILIFAGFAGRVLVLANANLLGAWADSLCLEKLGSPACHVHTGALANLSTPAYLRLMIAASVLGVALTLVYRILFSRLSAKAVSQIYDEVTLRTSRYPMRFFDINPIGRIVTRFSSDYGNIFRTFGGPLAEFLGLIFDLAGIALLMVLVSPWYILICLAIVVLQLLIYRLNRYHLREKRRSLARERSPSIAHFAETTQGAGTIRAYHQEASFFKRFEKLNSNLLNAKLSTVRAILTYGFQMNMATTITLLFTGLGGYALIERGLLSLGSLGVAFGFILLSGGTIQFFFEWLALLDEALIGTERLDQYLRLPIEQGAKLPQEAKFTSGHPQYSAQEMPILAPQLDGSLEFKNVTFRYAQDLPVILKDITFRIEPSERVGIIGRTGDGKSSLIQALFHLYPLSKGQIRIGGFKVKDYSGDLTDMPDMPEKQDTLDIRAFRRQIAFISQDPTLFRGSLRENLAVDPNLTDHVLTAALARVGLGPWFERLPKGLETEIEERGRNVSLGERQLICMARCVLQNTPYVVFDEATSSIDPQSEALLVRAMEEVLKGRTQIIIAHRLSTLEKCDRIIWIKAGEVFKIGKPQDVLGEFQGDFKTSSESPQ